MDDATFWGLIEAAWQGVEGHAAQRAALASGTIDEDAADALTEAAEDVVVPALRTALDALSASELLAFDRIMERRLYDIDRSEIQEHTDGSDDGFLYARGFIVAAGKGYYDAVNAEPSRALQDLECGTITYLSLELYEEKFGEWTPSEISRESCSNGEGWPD